MHYVALGDSTGVGIGAASGCGYVDLLAKRLASSGAGLRTTNLCMSGATSRTVLDHQVARAVTLRPSLTTLFVGGNDVWRGVSPPTFAGHVERIVERLAVTGSRIVLANVVDLSHAPAAAIAFTWFGLTTSAIASRVDAFNRSIAETAAKYDCTLVDLHGESGIEGHPEYFCGDGFHPSELGYRALEGAFWERIAPIARAVA